MGARWNCTLVIGGVDEEALRCARESMEGERSMPIARPEGPIRRAAWKTSKPAPEPRSRTVSPWKRGVNT